MPAACKRTVKVSDASRSIKTSGRNCETLYSVTNRRFFRRHGSCCKDPWRWYHGQEKSDCQLVPLRAWSELSQSADCQAERSRVFVWAPQHRAALRLVQTENFIDHRIDNIFWVWTALPSRLPQQDFNNPGELRTVLSLIFLLTLCTLTRVGPEFSDNSGSKWFSPWENSHEATIKIIWWAKL